MEDVIKLAVGFALGALLRDSVFMALGYWRAKKKIGRSKASAEKFLADLEARIARDEKAKVD